jgi:hypothetical protein
VTLDLVKTRSHAHRLSEKNKVLRIRELCDELTVARVKLKTYEDAEQAIIEHKLVSLPWEPHQGPPSMNATEALKLHRSARLSRGVMTDEERAAFVGDAKPT